MSEVDLTHDFEAAVVTFVPTGSRVICNPPPVGTDQDFIAYVRDDAIAQADMTALGYKIEGTPEFYTGNDNGGFRSYRKGDVNVITTPDHSFYRKFKTATELGRRFNLLDKGDRIALFQVVLYDAEIHDLAQRQADVDAQNAELDKFLGATS